MDSHVRPPSCSFPKQPTGDKAKNVSIQLETVQMCPSDKPGLWLKKLTIKSKTLTGL